MRTIALLGLVALVLAAAGVARTSAYFTDTVHIRTTYVGQVAEATASPSATPSPRPTRTAVAPEGTEVSEPTDAAQATHTREAEGATRTGVPPTRVPQATQTPAPTPTS